jgi:hypothetical protein
MQDKSEFISKGFPPSTKRNWSPISSKMMTIHPVIIMTSLEKKLVELSSSWNQHVLRGQVCILLDIHKPPTPHAKWAFKK